MRPLAAALLALVVCFAASPSRAQSQDRLTIVTASGPHVFDVEVARNEADRTQGLMYRRSLSPNYGMLFDFAEVAPVSMWMKNTYVPLDMIFIRRDGTVARVAHDTEPLSTRIIPSGEPVLGVLEVAAGTSRRLGIKAGDRVQHPLFDHS